MNPFDLASVFAAYALDQGVLAPQHLSNCTPGILAAESLQGGSS